MDDFQSGELVWLVLMEDEDGTMQVSGPATNVMVAPATVLEGGLTAEVTTGAVFDLRSARAYRDSDVAEQEAEKLAREG